MKRPSTFELYRDKARKYRWRFVASNGQITSGPQQGYTRKASALRSINRHIDAVMSAEVVEIPDSKPKRKRLPTIKEMSGLLDLGKSKPRRRK